MHFVLLRNFITYNLNRGEKDFSKLSLKLYITIINQNTILSEIYLQ